MSFEIRETEYSLLHYGQTYTEERQESEELSGSDLTTLLQRMCVRERQCCTSTGVLHGVALPSPTFKLVKAHEANDEPCGVP